MTDKTYTQKELEEMANALLTEDDKSKKADAKSAEAAEKADAKPAEDKKERASWTIRPSPLCLPPH